jgi:hypothetical protein
MASVKKKDDRVGNVARKGVRREANTDSVRNLKGRGHLEYVGRKKNNINMDLKKGE